MAHLSRKINFEYLLILSSIYAGKIVSWVASDSSKLHKYTETCTLNLFWAFRVQQTLKIGRYLVKIFVDYK